MPPPMLALLPEKVLLLTVSVPTAVVDAAAAVGAIAGEGAVAHGQRAAVCRCRRRTVKLALLPEKVLLLTVSVPSVVDAAAVPS